MFMTIEWARELPEITEEEYRDIPQENREDVSKLIPFGDDDGKVRKIVNTPLGFRKVLFSHGR